AVGRAGECSRLSDGDVWEFSEHPLRFAGFSSTHLVGGTTGGEIVIGDLQTRETWTLGIEVGESLPRALAWHPYKPLLATSFDDFGEILIVDIFTKEIVSRLKAPIAPSHLAFTPDGKQLVGGALTGALRLWDLETGETLWGRPTPQATAAVKISANGRRIMVVTARGIIRLFDRETGLPITLPVDIGEPITSAALDDRGELAIIGGPDGAIRWIQFPAACENEEHIDPAFLTFAEQFAGWRMDESGTVDLLPPGIDSTDLPNDLANWRDWVMSSPSQRSTFPGSADVAGDYVDILLTSENARAQQEGRRLRAWSN
ncbi:MAG: hypothetical protein AAF585_18820, partial [Verrucomicrobiota bacterium]